MSYEYTGKFLSPIDTTTIALILEKIEAMDYLQVVRRDATQLGIQLLSLPPSDWEEHLSVKLSEESVTLACHGGRGKEEQRFVRDLLILLSEHGADCTLIEL
jgi:hypothetical protein